MKRIMEEIEDSFGYHDEGKRKKPKVLIPEPEIYIPAVTKIGPPPFMKELVISQQKRQPVSTKLDSIEIKGSKVLARHPKSNYIEGTLFLMAKGYFYRNDWLPSQIKCSELIDRYPAGDWSADAHLLMAKNYLIRRKFFEGKLLLSRCVDIAWQKERYDILSEAFRLEAELALFEGDQEGALRPYKQAIAQSGDNELRARWQVDMAALLFRIGKFKKAERAFAKVHEYSPDYLADFEAYLYQASCLARLGYIEEAEAILDNLESDGNNEEWMTYIFAERYNLLRLQGKKEEITIAEKFADSAYVGSPALMGSYFENGMDYFRDFDYLKARTYFARSKSVRSPVFSTSQRLYYLINQWDEKRTRAIPSLQSYSKGEKLTDSAKSELSLTLFELGRVHEQLGNSDSSVFYYKYSVELCPRSDEQASRYLYAYSRILKESNPYSSDSLLDVIVEYYPLTDYGKDAMRQLGYTKNFVIDSVAELFSSGDRLRRAGDFPFAIQQFTKLYTIYPEEKEYAPKSLYSIGWIYERNLDIPDSALYFYQLLIEKYPYSKYAEDLRLSVAYLIAVRSGKELPDSLKLKIADTKTKTKQKKAIPVRASQKNINIKNPSGQMMQQATPDNIIEAPGNMLKGAQKTLGKPVEMIKNFKIPDNPLDFFGSSDEKDEKKEEDKKKEEKDSVVTKKPEPE